MALKCLLKIGGRGGRWWAKLQTPQPYSHVSTISSKPCPSCHFSNVIYCGPPSTWSLNSPSLVSAVVVLSWTSFLKKKGVHLSRAAIIHLSCNKHEFRIKDNNGEWQTTTSSNKYILQMITLSPIELTVRNLFFIVYFQIVATTIWKDKYIALYIFTGLLISCLSLDG